MKKKTKTASVSKIKAEKGDSLKMVVLGWILSGLAFISVSSLVPGFFGEGGFATDDEFSFFSTVWFFYIVSFVIPVFVVSFIISLGLSKESSNRKNLQEIARTAFVIASIINVTVLVIGLVVGELFPLMGIQM